MAGKQFLKIKETISRGNTISKALHHLMKQDRSLTDGNEEGVLSEGDEDMCNVFSPIQFKLDREISPVPNTVSDLGFKGKLTDTLSPRNSEIFRTLMTPQPQKLDF